MLIGILDKIPLALRASPFYKGRKTCRFATNPSLFIQNIKKDPLFEYNCFAKNNNTQAIRDHNAIMEYLDSAGQPFETSMHKTEIFLLARYHFNGVHNQI